METIYKNEVVKYFERIAKSKIYTSINAKHRYQQFQCNNIATT